MTTDPAIIEAAAREILVAITEEYSGSDLAAVIAVLSRIEADALEEAARVAEEQTYYPDTNIGMRQQWVKDQIAAKVRSLIVASPSPSADSA